MTKRGVIIFRIINFATLLSYWQKARSCKLVNVMILSWETKIKMLKHIRTFFLYLIISTSIKSFNSNLRNWNFLYNLNIELVCQFWKSRPFLFVSLFLVKCRNDIITNYYFRIHQVQIVTQKTRIHLKNLSATENRRRLKLDQTQRIQTCRREICFGLRSSLPGVTFSSVNNKPEI